MSRFGFSIQNIVLIQLPNPNTTDLHRRMFFMFSCCVSTSVCHFIAHVNYLTAASLSRSYLNGSLWLQGSLCLNTNKCAHLRSLLSAALQIKSLWLDLAIEGITRFDTGAASQQCVLTQPSLCKQPEAISTRLPHWKANSLGRLQPNTSKRLAY